MGLEIKQLTRLQIIRYCAVLEKNNIKLKEKLEEYEIENKKLRNSLYMKNGTIVGLKHQVKRLEDKLNKIKKRVKEHTTYSVKAEFIKKFGE